MCDKGTINFITIWENYQEIGNIILLNGSVNVDPIFECACIIGNLKVIKWIIRMFPNIYIDYTLFHYTYLFGYLEIAKFLLDIKPEINIYINYQAFYNSCYFNHLEIAKWLLKIKPEFNILIDNQVFCNSCSNGHLQIVKWLLEIKPDIAIYNDEAFRIVCDKYYFEGDNIYLEIAILLQNLYPDKYHINIENNNIDKIVII